MRREEKGKGEDHQEIEQPHPLQTDGGVCSFRICNVVVIVLPGGSGLGLLIKEAGLTWLGSLSIKVMV